MSTKALFVFTVLCYKYGENPIYTTNETISPYCYNIVPKTTPSPLGMLPRPWPRRFMQFKPPCLTYMFLCIHGSDVVMEEGFERTWRLTKKSYFLHAEVIAPLYDAMLRILESGTHLNLSEYMVDLIEKDIKKRGIELAPPEAFGEKGMEDVIRSPVIVESGVVSTRVPIIMIQMINRLLDSGLYLRVSDYVRYAIKKDLESRDIEPMPIKASAEDKNKPAKMWRPSETATVSTKVPMQMMEEIDRLLASGFYLRVSDYLIDLIRKDLEERGIEIK